MPIMQLTVEIPDFAMNGMLLDSFSVTVDPKGGVRLKGMLERVAGFRGHAPSYVKGTLRADGEPGIVCVDYCPVRPDLVPMQTFGLDFPCRETADAVALALALPTSPMAEPAASLAGVSGKKERVDCAKGNLDNQLEG